MIIGLIISVLLYIFVYNIITVGKNKYFIEFINSDDISYDALLYVYRIKK